MKRVAAVCAALSLAAVALATAAVDRSLEEMLRRADLLAYGQVREVTAETVDDEIRTRVVLDVERDLGRPEDPRSEVALSFLGGRTADGEVVTVEGVPRLDVGERVLVLAYEEEGLASPIVGVWQGLWRLGPQGLTDARGRLLTPTPDGLAVDGEGGDLTTVLNAIESWGSGEAEIVPGAAPSPADGGDAVAGPAESVDADVPEAPEDAADATVPGAEEVPAEPEDPEDAEAAAVRDEADEADEADRADADGAGPQDDPLAVVLRPPEDEALRDTIEEAAQAWREAGADLRVAFEEGAEDAIVAADPEPFGPDALSLTIRRADEPGAEVLIRSDIAASATGVVAYELAGLLGAGRSDAGLLSGRFGPEGAGSPSAADAARLVAVRDAVPGDLDADGDVDFYDLALLGEAYGRSGARLDADLDGSGRVDEADLDLLRERYEFFPPSPDPPPGRSGTDLEDEGPDAED